MYGVYQGDRRHLIFVSQSCLSESSTIELDLEAKQGGNFPFLTSAISYITSRAMIDALS